MAIIRISNIGAAALVDAAITADKLATGSVTSAKIADGTIDTVDIKTNDDYGLITGSTDATDDYGSIA